MKYFIFILIFTFSQSALYAKEDTIRIENKVIKLKDISHQIGLFVDTTTKLHINQIAALEFGEIRDLDSLNLGSKINRAKYNYWVHFVLNNNSSGDTLLIYFSFFDTIELYQIHNDSIIKNEICGKLVNYKDRPFKKNKYCLPISIPCGRTNKIYIKFKNVFRVNDKSISIKFLSHEEERFQREKLDSLKFIFIVFLSITFFAALFFFIIGILYGDSAYSYYTLYLFFLAVYVFWKFEIDISNLNLMFSHFSSWYYQIEVPLAVSLYLSYLFFLNSFLSINFNEKLNNIVVTYGKILVVYLILDRIVSYVDIRYGWYLYYIVRIPFGLLAAHLGYLIFSNKRKTFGFCFSGQFLFTCRCNSSINLD